jgi:hypothetical protein
MSSYTYTQLNGTGSIGEDLSGVKTFSFTNPSASSYFTLETNRNISGSYDAATPKNALGVYVVSESMYKIASPYITSVIVQPGISSFTFTPTSPVTGTTYYLRGTGMYSLVIS